VAKSQSEIVFVQPKDDRFTDDPKQRRPDITKAKAVLDWEPKVTLAEGLAKTLDFFHDKV
jgi:nucleoside-diphosphate-sugar epimerase